MKRRSFLGLFGAAATAPMMPSALAGGTTVRASVYNPAALHAAIYHAKSRAVFSVWGLAKAVNISMEQAETLMGDLAKRGILGPMQGTTFGGRWASSKIMASETLTKAQVARGVSKASDALENASNATPTDTPHDNSKGQPHMEKYTNFSGVAAPMPLVNIDTDMIIPKQFLKTIKRSGLGVNLFDEMRFDREGNEVPDFVLNQPQYRDAEILVAGDNFGCGSSREHAPWAIKDFGIRCVISTSFADIFYNNCFKNGILPIVLPQDQVEVMMADAEKGSNARIDVDLEAQTVTTSDGVSFAFEVDSFKKHCLLNGLDDIGLTMEKAGSIASYEASASAERPWV